MLPAATEAGFLFASEADWHFSGTSSGDQVGHSVAGAGDVNGDGYDDVIVGAPHDGNGTAYVFYGTHSGLVNEDPSVVLTSEKQGSQFGTSVAIAGDVNGDGYDDVIVGAPHYKNETTFVGAAFLFLGGSVDMDDEADWEYLGSEQGENLGASVGSAGDVNGDDRDDVIVGVPRYTDDPDGDEQSEGAALVFYGLEESPFLSLVPDWSFESNQAGAQLGSAVGTAGDVNNDNYDDIIAGAPTSDNTLEDEGAVFVFLGSSLGPGASPDWTSYGGQAYALFGTSVGAAGDAHGDGYDEVIIGAPDYDGPLLGDEGAAFVFCGNASGLGTVPCWTHISDQVNSGLGYSVGTAGDVDDDGCSDIIVGAPQYQPIADRGADGAAFVFHGSPAGLRPWAGWIIANEKNVKDFESGLAYAVGAAGDVNGDDIDDLILGAPGYFISQTAVGRAFAFYGPLEPAEVYRIFLPLIVRNSN